MPVHSTAVGPCLESGVSSRRNTRLATNESGRVLGDKRIRGVWNRTAILFLTRFLVSLVF